MTNCSEFDSEFMEIMRSCYNLYFLDFWLILMDACIEVYIDAALIWIRGKILKNQVFFIFVVSQTFCLS